MAERRISEFEDKSITIFQAIMQIEKIKKKKRTEYLQICGTTSKCITGIPEEEGRTEQKKLFEVMMDKLFAKLITDNKLQNKETERTTHRIKI